MSLLRCRCVSVAAMIFSAGTVSCTMLSSRIPATRHCGGVRCIATSRARLFFGRRKPPSSSETHLALRESMFKSEELRNREGFMEVVERFKVNNENRKGHVEFINVATRYVQEFGVEKDLEVYKTLFDLFPKGKYTPRTLVQAEFFHFPHHQDCGVRLLDTMESHGVIPDRELRQMVLDTFGFRSEVFKKFARMMYWMPKFKHMSPFPLPNPVPRDAFALAQLAVRRMCVDIQSAVSVHQTKEEVQDCVDDTWVVSGQAPEPAEADRGAPDGQARSRIEGALLHLPPEQLHLLLHPPSGARAHRNVSNIPITVYGEKPHSELARLSTVHEQTDGVILALGATGTSTRDSLLSWLRILQVQNPRLKEIPVVFMLKAPSKSLVTANQPQEEFEGPAEEEDEIETKEEARAASEQTFCESQEGPEQAKT
ncbi:hypothetical protein HPB48_015300 [Haemaphysalis longicornis]|uniref:Evolutionarily conserved signaling intermediate in Toll pathway, mitochondrial n=1 Tax=Haemaphysalis longicornis TaxID=44386 RepID=A0A9J6GI23_HAELO|nr:hypothetical protein HPB48_015300 [Haemaphysalis longicornis]